MKKLLFIHDNIEFRNQIEYCVGTIFDNFEVELTIICGIEKIYKEESWDLVIYYGDNLNFKIADVIILSSDLFNIKNYLKQSSIRKSIEYFETLPIFFKNKNFDFFVENIEEKIIFNIDIIQTLFYFLTSYEEFVINEYDKYGRFNINKSILYKFNLIQRPIVNETITFLMEKINLYKNIAINKKELWKDKDFAVLLSHDVDIISKFLPFIKEMRLYISMLLIDRKPKEMFKRVVSYIKSKLIKNYKDNINTFDYILDLEKKYNYHSSFYFMTDGSTYEIKNKKVKSLIKNITQLGNEIGLHPGLGTSNNEIKFMKQIIKFKNNTKFRSKIGIRQHYLSFYSAKTWNIHNKFKVLYDSSLGFPQIAGFKVGYCLPYKPYNLITNSVMKVWEIPLIVMDGSLLEYMKLDYLKSIEYISVLISEVRKHKGVFVLLWHNSALSDEYNIYAKDIFQWVYEYIGKLNCCVESGENIILQYKQE